MKVLLVNPACLDQRITDQDALVVPIGLYYLSAQLMAKGISAPILNLAGMSAPQNTGSDIRPGNSAPDPVALFKETIREQQPDIIGFSVTNPSRINAAACAAVAREIQPEVLIMFGGPAPTFMADHLFRACPALDLVVKGEGEISVSKLAAALQTARRQGDTTRLPEALNLVEGLIIRRSSGFTDTGDAPLVEDLDTLVHPSRYFRYQHLAMSRGCPGKCTFCGSPKFWGTALVRRHSPAWFFDEIRTLAAAGVTHFYISDDTFTMDRQAVLDFCGLIIDAGLSITWNAISRVDYIDAELLSAMRRAGCIQISFGVESGSDLIKKRLGKPVENAKSIEAFTLARNYGILPRAYFIYGSPGETDDTIDESIELMMRLAPLSTVFYMLVVFPGTHLYTRAVQKGLLTDDAWFEDIEDIPWFQLDPEMDFEHVKAFGHRLRQAFVTGLPEFVSSLELVKDPDLYPFHADFLSRLALTFSHGEYAEHPGVDKPEIIAAELFKKALTYGHDPRAYLGLAMLHQKQRQFRDAVTVLKDGLAQFPTHKDLNTCMGVCLMNLGDFSTALDHFTPFDNDPGLSHYISICKQKTNA